MNKKLRCAIYDRVSTDIQVKDGLSLEAQRQALTEYANAHGYTIAGYYTDEGITARKKMQNRKDLIRLLNDVKADKIDLILVTKLDRWFRNIKDYHNTQAILEAHNCNWKTIFEEYDTSTSNGRFAINIMLSVNENECDRDSERIRTVFEYKKQRREHLNGKPAYGYISHNKKLVKDPSTMHIVEDIYNRYFTTYSKKEVIRYITSKYGGSSPTACQINRILSCETYTGTKYGIPDYCEAYITGEQLYKIKSISCSKAIPHQHEPFLFSSMIKCPVCSRNLSGFIKRQKLKSGGISEYKRYRCSAKYKEYHAGACLSETVIEEYLIRKALRGFDGEALRCHAAEKLHQPAEAVSALRHEIARLNKLYQKGRISEEYYDEQYAILQEKLGACRDQAAVQNVCHTIRDTFRGGWLQVYQELNAAHKKAFWKNVIKEILVDKETRRICGFRFLP